MTRSIQKLVQVCVFALPMIASACGDSGNPPAETIEPTPEPIAPSPPAPSDTKSAALPAISGGTLAVLADGTTAIASDPDRDQVYVVDLASKTLRHTLMLNPGDEPGRHAQDASGMVHVVLRQGGAVLSFDPKTGKVLARRALCNAPRGIAFDGQRNLLHVACAEGQLVSIAPGATETARTLQLDRDLRDVVVKGEALYVSTFRQANVLTVDAGTGGVMNRVSPVKTRAVFQNIFNGKFPFPVPSGSPGSAGPASASPAVAWRMVAGPDGNPIVIHQRGVDGEVATQPGGYGGGHTCTGVVESAITKINAQAPEAARVRSTKALRQTALPVDIAIAPSGRQMAFVSAGQGHHQVQFMAMDDATTMASPAEQQANSPTNGMPSVDGDCAGASTVPLPEPETGTDVGTDMLPTPIEYRPPNGDVIAVAFDPKGNVVVQSRNPSNIQILTQRGDPIVLSTMGRYNSGHSLFHQVTPGQIACASCHPEGAEDSRAWTFQGIGARRTQSLRGGIIDTAPFHWDGKLSDLSHLMADVFQERMGGGRVSDDQVEALSGWIDSIPRVVLKGTADKEVVARGKALFFDPEIGCASCHAGPKLTNNKIADVGTGGALQTPQLMDLALRAPYMHTGCAKTLKDRFGGACGGDDRHGVTSKLSPPQIDDLIGYLETL